MSQTSIVMDDDHSSEASSSSEASISHVRKVANHVKVSGGDKCVREITAKLDSVYQQAGSKRKRVSSSRAHDVSLEEAMPNPMTEIYGDFQKVICSLKGGKTNAPTYDAVTDFIVKMFKVISHLERENDRLALASADRLCEAQNIADHLSDPLKISNDFIAGIALSTNKTLDAVDGIERDVSQLKAEFNQICTALATAQSASASAQSAPVLPADQSRPLPQRSKRRPLATTEPMSVDGDFLRPSFAHALAPEQPMRSRAGTGTSTPRVRANSKSNPKPRQKTFPPKAQKEQFVTVVFPKENVPDLETSEKVFTLVSQFVNPMNAQIALKRVHKVNRGGYLFETPTQADRDKLRAALKDKLGDRLEARDPITRSPLIKIHGVPRDIPDAQITEYIYAQNTFIREEYPNSSDFLSNITHRFNLGKLSSPTKISIFEVLPRIRSFLLSNPTTRISLGWFKCGIEDHFNLTQCFNCCGFAHVAKNCPSATPVCSQCSGPHKFTDCDKTMSKCPNCSLSGHKDLLHNAYDKACPILRSQRAKALLSTDFGCIQP